MAIIMDFGMRSCFLFVFDVQNSFFFTHFGKELMGIIGTCSTKTKKKLKEVHAIKMVSPNT